MARGFRGDKCVLATVRDPQVMAVNCDPPDPGYRVGEGGYRGGGQHLRVTGGHREGLGTVRLPVTSRLTHTVTGPPFLCLAGATAYFVTLRGGVTRDFSLVRLSPLALWLSGSPPAGTLSRVPRPRSGRKGGLKVLCFYRPTKIR